MIDIVHDIAGSYRELLEASSYPGRLGNLKKYIKKNTLETPFYETTLLFVYMLLDSEVTFCTVGKNAEHAENYMAKLTYAKKAPIEEADFIFILSSATDRQASDAIKNCKIGTLVDPHKSATIICEAKSVEEGVPIVITGPGIKDEGKINVKFAKGWIEARNDKNNEFPLGVEIYFTDKKSRVLALPRTTILKREEN